MPIPLAEFALFAEFKPGEFCLQFANCANKARRHRPCETRRVASENVRGRKDSRGFMPLVPSKWRRTPGTPIAEFALFAEISLLGIAACILRIVRIMRTALLPRFSNRTQDFVSCLAISILTIANVMQVTAGEGSSTKAGRPDCGWDPERTEDRLVDWDNCFIREDLKYFFDGWKSASNWDPPWG